MKKNNYYIETAYCYLVLDNFVKAKEIFESAKDFDIRAHWGLILIQMIEQNISSPPSYFEIRNFLETDLGYIYDLISQRRYRSADS